MEEIDVPNPTCRAQNCSLESLFLDDAEQHQPPACPTTCGRGQRFAVCCGPLLPRCGQGCCRQSLPPPTTAGPAAPQATAAPRGCGPAFLGSGMSIVRWMASFSARCETRNRAALAPKRVAGVLAPAFMSQRPPPDWAGAADPDPAHDRREPTLGSAEDPGGTGTAWVQSLRQNGREVYASNP